MNILHLFLKFTEKYHKQFQKGENLFVVNFAFHIVGGQQFDIPDEVLVTEALFKIQIFLEKCSHFLHWNFLGDSSVQGLSEIAEKIMKVDLKFEEQVL